MFSRKSDEGIQLYPTVTAVALPAFMRDPSANRITGGYFARAETCEPELVNLLFGSLDQCRTHDRHRMLQQTTAARCSRQRLCRCDDVSPVYELAEARGLPLQTRQRRRSANQGRGFVCCPRWKCTSLGHPVFQQGQPCKANVAGWESTPDTAPTCSWRPALHVDLSCLLAGRDQHSCETRRHPKVHA